MNFKTIRNIGFCGVGLVFSVSCLAQSLVTTNNTVSPSTGQHYYSSVILTTGLNKGQCAYNLDNSAYTGPGKDKSSTDWTGVLSVTTMCLLSNGTSSFPCQAEITLSPTLAGICNSSNEVDLATIQSNGLISVGSASVSKDGKTIPVAAGSYALTMG